MIKCQVAWNNFLVIFESQKYFLFFFTLSIHNHRLLPEPLIIFPRLRLLFQTEVRIINKSMHVSCTSLIREDTSTVFASCSNFFLKACDCIMFRLLVLVYCGGAAAAGVVSGILCEYRNRKHTQCIINNLWMNENITKTDGLMLNSSTNYERR